MKSKEALHGVAGRGKHEGTAVPSAPGGGGGGVGDLLGDLHGTGRFASVGGGWRDGRRPRICSEISWLDTTTPGYAATPTGASVDPLADLMGGMSMGGTSTQPTTTAPADPFAGGAAPADPLGDLMGTGPPSLVPQTRPQPAADPLGDLMGGIAATPAARLP